jgi:hypothetical protein
MAKRTCPSGQHQMPDKRCMKDAEMVKRKPSKPSPGRGRKPMPMPY